MLGQTDEPEWALSGRVIPHFEILIRLAFYSLDQRWISTAMVMYKHALQSSEEARGPSPSGWTSRYSVGARLHTLNKFEEAEKAYKWELQHHVKLWGWEHTLTLLICIRCARLYERQDRHKEAEAMYKMVLNHSKKDGPEYTLPVIEKLGDTYSTQKRYEEAEIMYLQAVLGYRKLFGPEHLWTLKAVCKLGTARVIVGRPHETQELFQQSLQALEKKFGVGSRRTLETIGRLAIAYHSHHQYDKAEATFQKLLKISEEQFGSEDVRTIWVRDKLKSYPSVSGS